MFSSQRLSLHYFVFIESSDTTESEYQTKIDGYIEKADTGSKLMCKECKKTFNAKSKASLIAHIESIHLKADINCSTCNKKFKATSYLKQHQKRGACAVK